MKKSLYYLLVFIICVLAVDIAFAVATTDELLLRKSPQFGRLLGYACSSIAAFAIEFVVIALTTAGRQILRVVVLLVVLNVIVHPLISIGVPLLSASPHLSGISVFLFIVVDAIAYIKLLLAHWVKACAMSVVANVLALTFGFILSQFMRYFLITHL